MVVIASKSVVDFFNFNFIYSITAREIPIMNTVAYDAVLGINKCVFSVKSGGERDISRPMILHWGGVINILVCIHRNITVRSHLVDIIRYKRERVLLFCLGCD
jgi:hypothetical protein